MFAVNSTISQQGDAATVFIFGSIFKIRQVHQILQVESVARWCQRAARLARDAEVQGERRPGFDCRSRDRLIFSFPQLRAMFQQSASYGPKARRLVQTITAGKNTSEDPRERCSMYEMKSGSPAPDWLRQTAGGGTVRALCFSGTVTGAVW